MVRCGIAAALAAFAALASGIALAETDAATLRDCMSVPDVKSKSRQLFAGETLMISLLVLEQQGEKDFRPIYESPASECVLERFAAAAVPVMAIYSPFEKGEHTLHYRFVATDGANRREILVIYDGLASLTAKKGPIFFVIENRAGNISYYAMFRDQPAYAALKALVSKILDGSEKPLATVRWPAGAKEPVIEAYDSDRLK